MRRLGFGFTSLSPMVYTTGGASRRHSNNYWSYLDDGITYIRIGIRGKSPNFVVDKKITELGFDGEENIDWRNIQSIQL